MRSFKFPGPISGRGNDDLFYRINQLTALEHHSVESGFLGTAFERAQEGTLLFDEVEKTHPCIVDAFQKTLDAVWVTIATGQTLDLRGFYVAMTSNLSSAELLSLEHSCGDACGETLVIDASDRLDFANGSAAASKVRTPVQRTEAVEQFFLDQLDRAGLGHNTFTQEALGLAVRSGEGLLRRTRNLCLSSLIEAVRDQTCLVDLKHVNRVLIQPHWKKDHDQPPRRSREQIQAALLAPLVPLQQQRGLQMAEHEAGNYILP